MAVTTWSFASDVQDWTGTDSSSGAGGPTSMSHVAGALRATLTCPGAAPDLAQMEMTSPDLNVEVQNGDTVAIDYGAPSDAGLGEPDARRGITIRATYTDTTTQDASIINIISGTLTLTMTVNKTLETIKVFCNRGGANQPAAETFTNDLEEVRLTTSVDPATLEPGGATAGSGTVGLGVNTHAFAPNQSGTHLFFAMEDAAGNQKIIKVNRPTSTAPTLSLVYNPGGGSISSIAKHPDIDKMIFHGNFGTDIGVIEHAIGAVTNTDKSPISIGAKLIQPLRVNLGDGTQIIAINRDDQDAIETEDGGDNWSVLNATLGQTVDAMDVGFFGKYIDDVVVIGGNDGSDENLGYSPNEAVLFREDTSATLKAVGSIVSIDRVNDLF